MHSTVECVQIILVKFQNNCTLHYNCARESLNLYPSTSFPEINLNMKMLLLGSPLSKFLIKNDVFLVVFFSIITGLLLFIVTAQCTYLFIIYLSRVLCLSYSCLSSCHPVTIAERSAILLVLIIKLTQETRGRD